MHRWHILGTILTAALLVSALSSAPRMALAQDDSQPAGTIAFASSQGDQLDLYAVTVGESQWSRLTTQPSDDRDAAWSPDGMWLAYVAATAQSEGAPRELAVINATTGVISQITGMGGHVSHPVWAPDSRRIAFTGDFGGNHDVFIVDLTTAQLANLTDHPADDAWPTWSPDGTRIAFQSDRSGQMAVYVANVDGSGLQPLTGADGPNGQPVWSPDGMRIAFVSGRSGNADIFVIDANGTNQVRLSNTPYDDQDPAWSPDGMRVAYAAGVQPGVTELYSINADGFDLRQHTSANAQAIQPSWSPDGQWIAYASNQAGSFDVLTRHAESGQSIVIAGQPDTDETEPRWLVAQGALGSSTPPPATEAAGPLPVPPTATAGQGGQALPAPPTATAFVPPTATPTPFATPMPTATVPPTITPQPTFTPQPPPDLLLLYSTVPATFDLVNVSGRRLDLASLVFQGAGRQIDAGIWLRSGGLSSPLDNFAVAGCLGLWELGAAPPPQPLECDHRHSWWESDNIVFWTSGPFTVTYMGRAVAVCEPLAGRCEVSLSGTTAQLPPPAAPPAALPAVGPAQPAGGELLLVYNAAIPSLDLVNVSGRALYLTPLAFQGNGRYVDSGVWLRSGALSSSLDQFAAGGCLGLWGLGVPLQPGPPECGTRHSWWESDEIVFWTGGTFTVTYGGAQVAVCDTVAGRCAVDLP